MSSKDDPSNKEEIKDTGPSSEEENQEEVEEAAAEPPAAAAFAAEEQLAETGDLESMSLFSDIDFQELLAQDEEFNGLIREFDQEFTLDHEIDYNVDIVNLLRRHLPNRASDLTDQALWSMFVNGYQDLGIMPDPNTPLETRVHALPPRAKIKDRPKGLKYDKTRKAKSQEGQDYVMKEAKRRRKRDDDDGSGQGTGGTVA